MARFQNGFVFQRISSVFYHVVTIVILGFPIFDFVGVANAMGISGSQRENVGSVRSRNTLKETDAGENRYDEKDAEAQRKKAYGGEQDGPHEGAKQGEQQEEGETKGEKKEGGQEEEAQEVDQEYFILFYSIFLFYFIQNFIPF